MWAIERTSWNVLYCIYNMWGQRLSLIIGVLYIQCETVYQHTQPVDRFETLCKSISNHNFWEISQKPKYIELMNDNLQSCQNKKRHGKNRDKEQVS